MSLSIILTCYNEIPLIFNSYEKIVSFMNLTKIEYEIIIVDDGSLLEVQKQLSSYFQKKENTMLMLSSINEGRGATVTKGIMKSTKKYAGFIDTDLEIPESSILNLYHAFKFNSADVIIGKRVYLLGLNMMDWFRYIASRIYFLIANIVLRLNFLDTESGVKIFDREKILPILGYIKDKRWFWDTEIIAESIRHNLKIAQIPVFVLRNKNKGSSVKIFRDAIRYFYSMYKYLRRHRNNKNE